MIYLDNAATTKVSNEVISEMNVYHLSMYANASSKHVFGKEIKKTIDKSRGSIAELINCKESEIYFNSGATEGINMVLKGFVEANIEKGQHIVTTKVEHKATLETCSYLESIGIDVTYLDVDANGLIDIEELREAISEETLIVSVLWINNETGVIQDIESISDIVNRTEAKLFLDATQVVGKMPINVEQMDIDMLCMSAHKFHGPKGIGALYIKDGIEITPILYGGGQERGFRSGTTNTPGIIGLSKACELADTDSSEILEIRKYLEERLISIFDCRIIGDKANRSPYISNVIINGIDADVVIATLKETIISTGSACNSEIIEVSHVLKHMGISDEDAFGALRFSISKYTTNLEIDVAIEELEYINKT